MTVQRNAKGPEPWSTWISHGPRSDDPTFNPQPGDTVLVGDNEEPLTPRTRHPPRPKSRLGPNQPPHRHQRRRLTAEPLRTATPTGANLATKRVSPSRIGVVDGFNLYHGGTSRFAKALGRLEAVRTPRPCIGVSSRADLDRLQQRFDRVVSAQPESPAPRTPLGQVDQEISIRARLANGSIDHVNIGYDITHMENGPLARLDSTRGTSFEYIDNTGRCSRIDVNYQGH